jgi:hypothetical protein
MASGAAQTDTWDVVGARPVARVVDAVPAIVYQAQTGAQVSVDIENVGLTPWAPAAIDLSFTGSADRTSEYTVMPDPGNPALVAPGATESFAFSVDVDPMATPEIVTLDVALATGNDVVTGRVQSDMGADVTDSWDVQACAASFCGDCNLDMSLSILDALLAAQISAAIVPIGGLPLQQVEQCDVDNDADVDILDALALAQAAKFRGTSSRP